MHRSTISYVPCTASTFTLSRMSNDQSKLFGAMTLLATITAAAEVKHAMEERRAGRDPSDQETDHVARIYLLSAQEEVRASLFQLRASLAVAQDGEPFISSRVRRFGDLMRIRRLTHLVQRIHQRLLSMYPAIPETLAEKARILHGQALALLETRETTYPEAAEAFIETGLLLCAWISRDLDPTPPPA